MYDRQTLLDIHRRAHESLHRLIAFCGTMTADELRRPLTGFGFPTVLRQLEHTIGAEVYWQTVVIRGYNEEATMPPLPDLGTMEAFREQTAQGPRWTVVDWKTDLELGARRASYERQVGLYAEAIARATGEPAEGLLLVV